MDENGTDIFDIISQSSAQAITVDYDLYAHFLDDADMSEDQKREVLQALWNIIVEFVAIGYEVHPVQQAQRARNACGKLPETRNDPPISGQNAVVCKGSILANDFSDVASGKALQAAERIRK